MKVRTFRARSIEKAVEQIKKEFGSDALILSTRPVQKRWPWGAKREEWEVTAGLALQKGNPTPAPAASTERPDPDSKDILPAEEPRSESDRDFETPESSRPAAMSSFAPASRMIHRTEVQIEEVLEEIDELKRSIRMLGQALPQLGRGAGNDVYAELVGQRLEPDLAAELVERAIGVEGGSRNMRAAVRKFLADLLQIAPPLEFEPGKRIVSAFIGPTGVGKTTAIAKVAGQAAARHGKKVALVTTDTFRVTGQEQLVRYGQLLGIPVYKCSDLQGLASLVRSLTQHDLVLIDTAGCSPSDLARLGRLENALRELEPQIRLVLSATTRSDDINRIYKRFRRCSPDSVVITKLDETDNRGAILCEALRYLLPVCFLSDGQGVPEALSAPDSASLARLIIPPRREKTRTATRTTSTRKTAKKATQSRAKSATRSAKATLSAEVSDRGKQ
jgi:flagellar biosynthesis protein FlhF